MKYYHYRCYTPFVGEEMDVFISATSNEELGQKIDNAIQENGMEWYDEETWLFHWGYDEDADDYDSVCDEYYAQCGATFINEITEEKYEKLNKRGEWCI